MNKHDFASIDLQSLDHVIGGNDSGGGGSSGAARGAGGGWGDVLKPIADALGGGGPQINTNVQTGQNNQNNNNTGSGNQTITNNGR